MKPGTSFDLPQQIVGEFDVKILDSACFQAGEMAVGIIAVSIKPSACPIEAFDHSRTLESLEILINRGMADPPSLLVELFEDVSSAEVTGFAPQQVEHHPSLPAQSHAQMSATLECILKGALFSGSLWQK